MEKNISGFYKDYVNKKDDVLENKISSNRELIGDFYREIGKDLLEDRIGELVDDFIRQIENLSKDEVEVYKGEIIFARALMAWFDKNKSGKISVISDSEE